MRIPTPPKILAAIRDRDRAKQLRHFVKSGQMVVELAVVDSLRGAVARGGEAFDAIIVDGQMVDEDHGYPMRQLRRAFPESAILLLDSNISESEAWYRLHVDEVVRGELNPVTLQRTIRATIAWRLGALAAQGEIKTPTTGGPL